MHAHIAKYICGPVASMTLSTLRRGQERVKEMKTEEWERERDPKGRKRKK